MNSSIARRLEKAERVAAEKLAQESITDPAGIFERILVLLSKAFKRKYGIELSREEARARFGPVVKNGRTASGAGENL